MARIIGIGETVLDILFKNDQPQAAIPGGSTFNSIISLGRAGMDCYIVTETGDDHIGDLTCNYLQRNGVRDTFVSRQQGMKSHLSLAFLNQQNDAQYVFYKDHASVRMQARELHCQPDDALLFGSFFSINPAIRPAVKTMLQEAHDAGATLYYDINFRQPHIADLPQVYDAIMENMALSSIVRASTEDLLTLFGTDHCPLWQQENGLQLAKTLCIADLGSADAAIVEQAVSRLYQGLIRHYCQRFICTTGSGAVYLCTPQFYQTFTVNKIPTVSTVGAGDNFNAVFLYGLVKNGLNISELTEHDWSTCIEMGKRFAQDVCQSYENSISPTLVHSLR